MTYLLIWITLTGASQADHPPIQYASMELCQEALWNLTPPEERNAELQGSGQLPGWYCVSETGL